MFSALDILDIAIRLEKNGEKTYRDAGRLTADEELQELLNWIADEERSHAHWFSELKDRLSAGEDHHLMAELSRALVEDVVRGQTFSLQEVDFETIEKILDGDHGLVAGSGKGANADPLCFGKGKQLGAHVSGLGDHGGGTGQGLHQTARAVQIHMGVADTHGIGPQNQDTGCACGVDQIFFQTFARRPCFLESR